MTFQMGKGFNVKKNYLLGKVNSEITGPKHSEGTGDYKDGWEDYRIGPGSGD